MPKLYLQKGGGRGWGGVEIGDRVVVLELEGELCLNLHILTFLPSRRRRGRGKEGGGRIVILQGEGESKQ